MAISRRDRNDKPGGTAPTYGADAPSAAGSASPDAAASLIERLYSDHARQREFSKLLTLIAEGIVNQRSIAEAAAFIEIDLARHWSDEETSFFPLLCPYCLPEDRIEVILDLLAQDHRTEKGAGKAVVAILKRLAAGGAADARECSRLREFGDRLRRHLALENGVLLPIARARMTPEALRGVSAAIAADRPARRTDDA